jgi:hypothetical protein
MLEVKAAGERGDALEHCIAALFAAYPGLFRDEGRFLGPGEKDRVITVLAPDGTVPATWGTKTLYVDCKNEQARYTSAYASVFLTRLREVHGNTGLAVAPAGFTREKDSNAAAVFREAFIRKEALIGTIASADLLAVCETPWWEIAHQSLVAAREGTPR